MEQQVELANGEGAQVALLAMQNEVASIAALLLDVVGRIYEHPGRTGRWVAYAHSLCRLQKLDYQADDRPGCVELATLLSGIVGELVDQVLVGVAQHISRTSSILDEVPVTEVQPAEVVQQTPDDALTVGGAAELGLVIPVGAGQHSVEPRCVGLLNCVAGNIECLTEVHRGPREDRPSSNLRHEELVLVAIGERDFAGNTRPHCALHLLVESV